jgi:hypothetical protein
MIAGTYSTYTLMMEIIHYSETLASTYKSTWNYNPEDKK